MSHVLRVACLIILDKVLTIARNLNMLNGSMLVSDDDAGTIDRIYYEPEKKEDERRQP